jgi:hypothetical protein
MDDNSTTIGLTVTDLILEFGHSQSTPPMPRPTRSMSANCRCADYTLRLSSEEPISEFEISLSLESGTYPGQRSIGFLDYSSGPAIPSEIGGSIHLPPDQYKDVWEQASRGAFTECIITMDLAPLDIPDDVGESPIWEVKTSPRLSIQGATVSFVHKRTHLPR